MKQTLLIIILFSTLTNAFCQTINKKLTEHFEKNIAELNRYGGLTIYGEIKTEIPQDQINTELELFEEIKKSSLIENPTNEVFALCHNLQIHSPEKGKEFLKLLNKPTKNKETIKSLFVEMIFSGEFGEQLAIENLDSANSDWKKTWAYYLSKNAIYDSSIPNIEKYITNTKEVEIQLNLISSLMYISNLNSVDFIKQIIETTKNDEIQTKAIFCLTELLGFNGLNYLEKIKPIGEKSNEELKSSIEWLKTETSTKKIYGTEVSNDTGFIMRFGDIKSPAMNWLEKEGLLKEGISEKPIILSKEKKDKLIELLIESKGFGLEAIKGTLFLSIEKEDLNKFILLRKYCFYSPNSLTYDRLNTIGIIIRYLKRK